MLIGFVAVLAWLELVDFFMVQPPPEPPLCLYSEYIPLMSYGFSGFLEQESLGVAERFAHQQAKP